MGIVHHPTQLRPLLLRLSFSVFCSRCVRDSGLCAWTRARQSASFTLVSPISQRKHPHTSTSAAFAGGSCFGLVDQYLRSKVIRDYIRALLSFLMTSCAECLSGRYQLSRHGILHIHPARSRSSTPRLWYELKLPLIILLGWRGLPFPMRKMDSGAAHLE